MKKKDLINRINEDKRKPQPIKVKLDFDKDEDGKPDSYDSNSKHSNKSDSNEIPDFYSLNFNDEGTNVRPLHKNTDGKKTKKNKHSGDNHIHTGNDFTVSDENKPKVGHDNWSGDDHLFEVIEEISSKILLEDALKVNKKYL